MVAKINVFLDNRIKEGVDRREMDALRRLFEREIDARQAAVQFTSTVYESKTVDKAKDVQWDSWNIFGLLAGNYPEHHDALVDLIVKMTQLPDVVIKGEIALKWDDLTTFGWFWGEFVFDGHGANLGRNCGDYENHAAYTAKMTGSGLESLDFSAWGIDECNNAFKAEAFVNGSTSGARGGGPTPSDHQARRRLEQDTRIAARWILSAGRILYEKNYSDWALWRTRAVKLSEYDKFSSETRRLAAEAVVRMKEITENSG